MNAFDNDLSVESAAVVVWQDRTTVPVTDLLRVGYTAVDPNGGPSAPIGSLLSGPAGTWRNTTGGSVWEQVVTAVAGAGAVTQIGSVGGTVIASDSLVLQIAGSVAIAPGALDAVGRTIRCRVGMHCSAKGGIAIPGLAIVISGSPLVFFPSSPTILGKTFVMDLLVRTTIPGVVGFLSFTATTTDTPFFGGPSSGGVLPAVPIDLTIAQSLEIGVLWNVDNLGLDAVTLDAMVVDLGL